MARLVPSRRQVTRLGVGVNGWKWERAVMLGLGGIVRHVTTLGPAILQAARPLMVQSEVQTYPGALESVQPGYDTMIGQLSQVKGNIALDEAILRENEHAAIITDHYRNLMDGVQLNIALTRVSGLYTPSAVTRHICSVSSWTLVDGNNGSFIPTEGNEMMFHEGMMVQFYDTFSAGTLISHRHTLDGSDLPSVRIMVTAVNPITRRVYVTDIDGANRLNIAGNAVAADDIVVHQGQLSGGGAVGTGVGSVPVPLGSFGLVDWLINTGTVLGISTNTYQRLKSLIKSNLGGPWTEQEADRMLAWYYRWHRKKITDLYMTEGARLAYKNTMLGMFRADRTAKIATIVGGHKAEVHIHNGEEVNYNITPYMRAGFIIGVYMGESNFEELHPPADPSSRMNGEIPGVEFKAWAESNYRSIFRAVSVAPAGGGPVVFSGLREAPFSMWYQWWPMVHMPGLVVGGVTEDNWSET